MTDPAALKELTLNRIRVMLREPEVMFWVFVFPALLVLGIGLAFSGSGTEVVRVGVEEGSEGERLLSDPSVAPDLDVVVLDEEDALTALRRGEVSVVVGDGPDGATVSLRLDPARPEARMAGVLVEEALQVAAGATRPLAIDVDEVQSRGQRYIDWLIPGLIGFNLMGTGLWSVGFYTTQARENRELRRLIATPMRRSDFLLAQILARYVFLFGEIPLIVVCAWLAFGVPVVGDLLSLSFIVLLGATCFTGMGLLAASRARTTEGASGIINVIMMPMLVLSGVFFSTERFPDAAQPFVQALPLTALNNALRAVYNEGAIVFETLPDLGIVAGWTVGSFLLALRLFRWQ